MASVLERDHLCEVCALGEEEDRGQSGDRAPPLSSFVRHGEDLFPNCGDKVLVGLCACAQAVSTIWAALPLPPSLHLDPPDSVPPPLRRPPRLPHLERPLLADSLSPFTVPVMSARLAPPPLCSGDSTCPSSGRSLRPGSMSELP